MSQSERAPYFAPSSPEQQLLSYGTELIAVSENPEDSKHSKWGPRLMAVAILLVTLPALVFLLAALLQ